MAATDLLRPSAEKAWPDERTSDALCRVAIPKRSGLLPASSGAPKSILSHVVTMTSHERPRCTRLAENAAGLGRRTSNKSERLPLDRPRPCGLGGQQSRSLFTCTVSVPHPIACCERSLPRQRLTSHLRLSSHIPLRVASTAAATGKMRLANFCNRLTKRAPSGLPDSRRPFTRNLTDHRVELIRWSFAWRRSSSFSLATTLRSRHTER